jgi:hypothetical protein
MAAIQRAVSEMLRIKGADASTGSPQKEFIGLYPHFEEMPGMVESGSGCLAGAVGWQHHAECKPDCKLDFEKHNRLPECEMRNRTYCFTACLSRPRKRLEKCAR